MDEPDLMFGEASRPEWRFSPRWDATGNSGTLPAPQFGAGHQTGLV